MPVVFHTLLCALLHTKGNVERAIEQSIFRVTTSIGVVSVDPLSWLARDVDKKNKQLKKQHTVERCWSYYDSLTVLQTQSLASLTGVCMGGGV